MAKNLHIEGVWPSQVTVRMGWWRGMARPWNDSVPDGYLRMDRGSSGFINSATVWLHELGVPTVFSPALHRPAGRTWAQAGYDQRFELSLMERSLAEPPQGGSHGVIRSGMEEAGSLVEVDRLSFAPQWQMGLLGLNEAMAATPTSIVLTVGNPDVIGFAIVGAQMGLSFLQRVAVVPDLQGTGLGSLLTREAIRWALERGARTMILNVRPDNHRAIGVYQREGFAKTGSSLIVMGKDV